MNKKVTTGREARELLLKGAEKIYNAVAPTLGPSYRNAIDYNRNAPPNATNDGATVARAINLKSEEEDAGAKIIRDVALKANDNAGDGTTTATVIAYAIAKEGIPLVTAGMNPIAIKDGIDKASSDVVQLLEEMAIPIEGKEQIKQIATISAQDEEMGNVIADVLDRIGQDSVVSIEESPVPGYSSSIVDGYQVDAGYFSPYLINNENSTKCVLDKKPRILLTDFDISNVDDILPLFQEIVTSGIKDICIVAPSFGGDAFKTLLVNHINKKINLCLIKCPGLRGQQYELLQDIAIVTGGNVISDALGKSLKNAKVGDLGQCEKVEATINNTVLIGTKGSQEEIDKRKNVLISQKNDAKNEFEKEKLQERIAKIGQGVSVIYIGAHTELERKQKKDKLEDAINAARASVDEGIICGGGSALAKISYLLSKNEVKGDDSDFNAGYSILLKAIEYPLKRICENAGLRSEVILDNVQKSEDRNYGYDAKKKVYCNMIESGVIDPVKVTKSSVQSASSAAGVLLTTEVLITNEIDEPSSN